MSKFKNGDEVTIINRKAGNTTGCMNYAEPNGDVGSIGIVTGNSEDNYRIENPDNKKRYFGIFDEDDLELVPKYKKGDIYPHWQTLKKIPTGSIAKDVGIKEGDLLVLVDNHGTEEECGSIFELTRDDGTGIPFFDDRIAWSLDRFAKLPEIELTGGDKEALSATSDKSLYEKHHEEYFNSRQAPSKPSECNELTPKTMSAETPCCGEQPSTLSAWARRTFSPSQRALFKAGYIDKCGEPTQRGLEELNAIQWQATQKELVESANEAIKEAKENKT